MSIGKRYWEFTHGDTPLHRRHKWANKVVPYDGLACKTGEITINWNPADPPEGFKPMDPEE